MGFAWCGGRASRCVLCGADCGATSPDSKRLRRGSAVPPRRVGSLAKTEARLDRPPASFEASLREAPQDDVVVNATNNLRHPEEAQSAVSKDAHDGMQLPRTGPHPSSHAAHARLLARAEPSVCCM